MFSRNECVVVLKTILNLFIWFGPYFCLPPIYQLLKMCIPAEFPAWIYNWIAVLE